MQICVENLSCYGVNSIDLLIKHLEEAKIHYANKDIPWQIEIRHYELRDKLPGEQLYEGVSYFEN